jgi:hypothetical protein
MQRYYREKMWERWFAVFSPPEYLLTDLGKPLLSAIIRNLCARAGAAKIFTSGYPPQCNGMMSRFNRALAAYLAKTILCEESWPEHVATCEFRYNNSVHSATGATPYSAMFDVYCFEFDAGINLRMLLNDEPEDLAVRLAEIHERLYDKSLSTRNAAGRVYDRAVKETGFAVGERVFVFYPPGLIEDDRKIVSAWMGPYVLTERPSEVAYLVEDRCGHTSRVHMNRLTRKDPGVEVTQYPMAGMFPDTRRLLRLLGCDVGGKRFKVRSKGRKGYIWTNGVKPAGCPREGVQAGPSGLPARSGTSVEVEEEGTRAQDTDQAVSDVKDVM